MHEGELYSRDKKLPGTVEVAPSGLGRMVEVFEEDICGGKVKMKFDGVPYEGMCIKAAGMCHVATHENEQVHECFPTGR